VRRAFALPAPALAMHVAACLVSYEVAVPALRESISRIPSYWAGVTTPADLEVSP
jgi:hypothetical protein